MQRDDLIERTIRQLADALARAMNFRKQHDLVAALAEVEAALASVAGADPRLLDSLDPALLAGQLDPVRVAAIGQLLAARAVLELESGDRARAERTRTRAVAYLREADARGALDADGRGRLDALQGDG
ncbi:MAG TPA: hypothetical protein VD838_18040 [Anaeromyxobacteraceae bacterium]|nr:hypothetical protein [Anaeromyxobacteraceae bacterium]